MRDIVLDTNADYIVSNDAHFNALKQLAFLHIDVINIEEFASLCV